MSLVILILKKQVSIRQVPGKGRGRIHSVPVEQDWEVVEFLGRVLSPHEMSLRSLNPEDLTRERLDNIYRSHGLGRTREAYYAETWGRIQAVAFLEKASSGLNFSHFFNKFHLYFVGGDLDRAGSMGVLSQVLAFLLSSCRKDGQDFLVCLCESDLSGLFQALGYQSQNRYSCRGTLRQEGGNTSLSDFETGFERVPFQALGQGKSLGSLLSGRFVFCIHIMNAFFQCFEFF